MSKTAMELALARIEMLYIEKDSIHWEMYKNYCIEKEKKQIIEAYVFGFKEADFNTSDEDVKEFGKEFYNEKYNQNK